MRIECPQQKIKEVISLAERIVGRHMTLPVLSCFLLEVAKNNTITLKATNLDLGIEISLPAKTEGEGVMAIPGTVLSSFINGLGNEDKSIRFDLENGNLKIKTTTSSGVIKTIPPEDFPTLPRVRDGQVFMINSTDFIKGLKSVWYSSSVSSIKPELASVYIYCDHEYMIFVATDSFRLAEKKVRLGKAKDFGQILLPYKNIPEIVRVLEGINGEVEVNLDKNQISFSQNGIFLISRVIDGVFPDYKQIIPKNHNTEVTILKQDLINALKLSNIFSDKFNQVNLKINPSANKCEIKTKNNDVGENLSSLEAAVTGEALEINFNYKYIIDCFQSIDSDSVILSFAGLNRPMIIAPVSDQTFRYLVMPMNR